VGGIGDHPQLVILDDRGRLQLPGQIFDELLEYGRRHGMTSQLSSRIRVLPPTALPRVDHTATGRDRLYAVRKQ
jgi:hypothetical protein